jgi:uncharacterized membrane protein YjgN (DUF898 family)
VYEEVEVPDARAVLVLLGLVVLGLIVLSLIGLGMSGSTLAAMRHVRKGHTHARYDGRTRELFVVYLQNIVLTVLTLGVYRFWAKVRMTRHRYQHTTFADGRFDYHATGGEKFAGFVKGMLILAPVVGGLYVLYRALVPELGDDTAFAVALWSFVLILFLLRPLILVGSQRFNLSRTSWSNLRFRFTGQVGPAYRLYLRDLLLMVLTLGIYSFWHQCNVRSFRMEHTRIGDLRFGFRGSGGELLGFSLAGILLSYLTLGIYLPWYIARLHRFHVHNTTLQGRSFHSQLRGGHVLSVGAPALLAIVLTAGLAIPWALTRWWRLVTDTTSYPAAIDVERLRAIHDAGAGAAAEGIGEAGEVLSELGDLFGA